MHTQISTCRVLVLALVLLLPASAVEGRPGGGGSFRSSSSGSRSSGSSYRSSSSGSSYRSSSGSSYRSSSGSRYTPPPRPVVSLILERGAHAATMIWQPGGPSPYASLTRAPSFPCTVDPRAGRPSPVGWIVVGSLVIGLVLVITRVRRKKATPYRPAPEPVRGRGIASQLDVIREVDPDFSIVLLEDFLYALYAEAHTARGQKKLDPLAPYLKESARQTLATLGEGPVTTIVVGSMTLLKLRTADSNAFWLEVEFEANYTEGERSYYVREQWVLMRQRTARSRPPDRVRVFCCPNCGGPLDRVVGKECGYCGQVVTTGRFDWVVHQIEVLERETRGPMLTGTTAEQGTELPTVQDPKLQASLAALSQRDPQFSQDGLVARVRLIFDTMQVAWSSLEWERARPFLSDSLHEAQSYWIRAYRAAKLRNVTENARISRAEIARVLRDRWFDIVTVRIYASSLDYTVDGAGQVVGGSKSKERAYTEYWTLIRSAARQGPAGSTPCCPQCGGPLAITMAGQCEHCQAKVNSGEFDWVLSRIEQDEVYQG
jgi:hypothetical protein